MNVKLNTEMNGKIKNIKVFNSDQTTKEYKGFGNLILKKTLINTYLGGLPNPIGIDRLYFGTGTSPTTPDMLGLESPDPNEEWGINLKNVVDYYFVDDATKSFVQKFELTYRTTTAGFWAGTWSELGIGNEDRINTRALIKDEIGNPISITVGSDEYVEINYEIEIWFSLNEPAFSVNIGGISYSAKLMMMPGRLRAFMYDEELRHAEDFLNHDYQSYQFPQEKGIRIFDMGNGQYSDHFLCSIQLHKFDNPPTNETRFSFFESRLTNSYTEAVRDNGEDLNGLFTYGHYEKTTLTLIDDYTFKAEAVISPGIERIFDIIVFSQDSRGGSPEYELLGIVFDDTVVLPADEELRFSITMSWG